MPCCKGMVVAGNVAPLHGSGSNLNSQTALTATGAVINGRGDNPKLPDLMTSSQPKLHRR